MINWWVDISLCFTRNKHYVLWQTLSPTLSYIHSALVPRIRPIFRVQSPVPFPMIFAIFSLKSPPNTMVNPSRQWQSTRDSPVLPIRPIFRVRSPEPVSDDFRHFFTQIATEYDGDPVPTVAECSRLGGTADSVDFQGPIARPVSDDFRHFFTQIATESLLRAGDSPYARSTRF